MLELDKPCKNLEPCGTFSINACSKNLEPPQEALKHFHESKSPKTL